jgi:hypothetical protein
MEKPPENAKVVRLVKKPAEEQKKPAPTPPREARERVAAPPPPRPLRPPRPPRPEGFQPRGQKPWGKKPFYKDRPQRQPRVPPAPRRPPKPAAVFLTQEQRAKIVELYRAMVVAGERPPEGRRNKIAALMNIPYQKVAEVVQSYLQHERLRRTNFDIEKAYWAAVRAGTQDARAIADQIAQDLKLDVGRIWWWLEKLHESRKAFTTDPDVSDEQRAKILTAYEAYLRLSVPPEKGLHLTIAEQVGEVTPRQVHRALWEHRANAWKQLQGTLPEDRASKTEDQK